MGKTRQYHFFDKSVRFLIDHVYDRVMFSCMTVGTYQNIFVCDRQALRGHGGTYCLFSTLCIQECSRIFQARNNISSVLFLFFSAVKGKVIQFLLLRQHLKLSPQRIYRSILIGYQIFRRRFCSTSVYIGISPESQSQCQYHHQHFHCQSPDFFLRLFVHVLPK